MHDVVLVASEQSSHAANQVCIARELLPGNANRNIANTWWTTRAKKPHSREAHILATVIDKQVDLVPEFAQRLDEHANRDRGTSFLIERLRSDQQYIHA